MVKQIEGKFLHQLRRLIVGGAMVFAVLMVAVACIKDEKFTHENTTIVGVGDVAPDFSVELLDGSICKLSEYKGETVMLIFFSAECPDCHAQFAEIERQIAQAEPLFDILAISRGDSHQMVEEFKAKYNLEFEIGLDPDKRIYSLYASRYVPRCFLIGGDGKVKKLTVEYNSDTFKSIWNQAQQSE